MPTLYKNRLENYHLDVSTKPADMCGRASELGSGMELDVCVGAPVQPHQDAAAHNRTALT